MNAACVYCGQTNQFNGEHVFPAGLGGDDKRFMIRDCVCNVCNTYFSTLEVELSRKTPSALARLIKQSQGRDRGGKSSPPILQTESSYVIDPGGRILEAKISAGMATTLIPQIHVDGEKIIFTASEENALYTFIDECKKVMLAPEIKVVEKIIEESAAYFSVRVISQDEDRLIIGDAEVVVKAPAGAIWIKNPLQNSKHDAEGLELILTHRFYHHEGRSITYKASDPSKILEDIIKVRQFLKAPDALKSYTDEEFENPLVSVEMGFDIQSVLQAYAKIGMNFLIHLGGMSTRASPVSTV